MAESLGIAGFLHSGTPVTEGEIFERFNLQGCTITTGAVLVRGKMYIPSHAARNADSELEVFCLDPRGKAVVLKARKDGSEIFASSLTLAW